MHDLNVINRLNAEAFADSIQNYRRQGRWVLAKYEGLALVSIETFTVQEDAQAMLDVAVELQHGGERNVLFAPIPTVAPLKASDFPVLAGTAPVRPAEEKTLGDYITRKSALLDNPKE